MPDSPYDLVGFAHGRWTTDPVQNDDTSSSEPNTASESDEFNHADVAFASGMIQHHAQALAMVDLNHGPPD